MTAAQKEIVLIWTMLTTNGTNCNPLQHTKEDIVDFIAAEFNRDNGGHWNWPALGRTTAIGVVEEAQRSKDAFDSASTAFDVAGRQKGWPGGGDHPLVAEIRDVLGIPKVA